MLPPIIAQPLIEKILLSLFF